MSLPVPNGPQPSMDLVQAIQRTGLALLPFQRAYLRQAFDPGISVAALSTPRGAGKTELLGRIGGLGVVEGSPVFRAGHEVVIFAGSMRQARHLFRAAKRALPDPEVLPHPRQQSGDRHPGAEGHEAGRLPGQREASTRTRCRRAPPDRRRTGIVEPARRRFAVVRTDRQPREATRPTAVGLRNPVASGTGIVVAGTDPRRQQRPDVRPATSGRRG